MATKLHIEFDIELNDQWKDEFKDPYSMRSLRARQRMATALDSKFQFGTISELTISPKHSEV